MAEYRVLLYEPMHELGTGMLEAECAVVYPQSLDEDSLTHLTRRNRDLVRALNIRRGMRRADEAPPEDHWKRRFPELEENLLDTYYAFKGWNREGIPTGASLRELDLDYVAEDFVRRGILDENDVATAPAGSGEGRES